MSNDHLVVAKDGSQHGGGHATMMPVTLDETSSGLIKHSPNRSRRGCFRLGFLKDPHGCFSGQAAGNVAVSFSANSVGKNRQTVHFRPCLKLFRLPEKKEVFVLLANRPGTGKLATFTFHGFILVAVREAIFDKDLSKGSGFSKRIARKIASPATPTSGVTGRA